MAKAMGKTGHYRKQDDRVDMIRLAVLLVLLSAVPANETADIQTAPWPAVVVEMGAVLIMEPEMTWRINDTRN